MDKLNTLVQAIIATAKSVSTDDYEEQRVSLYSESYASSSLEWHASIMGVSGTGGTIEQAIASLSDALSSDLDFRIDQFNNKSSRLKSLKELLHQAMGRDGGLVSSTEVDVWLINAVPHRKISCIKAVRLLTGHGLRESKDIVDHMIETSKPVKLVTMLEYRVTGFFHQIGMLDFAGPDVSACFIAMPRDQEYIPF